MQSEAGPEWYRQWWHDAMHELIEKNERLRAEFNLGKWERYDYDIDRGLITFSQDEKPKVLAEIQVVGTTATNAGNWLWAWANAWWPEAVCEDARAARRFGEEHTIPELTAEYLTDDSLDALGWELTAVTVRVTNARGAYRAPTEKGYLFLLYRTLSFVA